MLVDVVYDSSCHVWYSSHHDSYWWHMIRLVMIYYTLWWYMIRLVMFEMTVDDIWSVSSWYMIRLVMFDIRLIMILIDDIWFVSSWFIIPSDGIGFVSSCSRWLLEIYDSSRLGYDIWDFGYPLCWCMPALYCVHVHMSIASSVMSSRSYFVCTSVVVCICCQKSGVANRLLWHCERDYFTNVIKIFLTMFLESMICVGWTTG